jgi:LysM repeat protein
MHSTTHHPARIVALLIPVVLVFVLLLARGVGAASPPGIDSAPVVAHRVAAGDTLWDIAAAHTDPGEDVRKTVFRIREINDLDGSIILPGQELAIPTG